MSADNELFFTLRGAWSRFPQRSAGLCANKSLSSPCSCKLSEGESTEPLTACFAGRKQYPEALQLLLQALTAPTMVVNAITVAAFKKYTLVSLIHSGENKAGRLAANQDCVLAPMDNHVGEEEVPSSRMLGHKIGSAIYMQAMSSSFPSSPLMWSPAPSNQSAAGTTTLWQLTESQTLT